MIASVADEEPPYLRGLTRAVKLGRMMLLQRLPTLARFSALTGLAAMAAFAQQPSTLLSDTVRAVAVGSEPVTVTLVARPELASALARQGEGTVALAVERVAGKTTQPIRINVFVDRPEATRTTPIDDPRFLGYLYIIPRRGDVKDTGRAFDLSRVPDLDASTHLKITLVPIAGIDSAPRDSTLTIGQIYLRRED